MVEGRPEVEDVRPAKALEALRRISIVGDILIDELHTLIGFGCSEKRRGLPCSPLSCVQIHPSWDPARSRDRGSIFASDQGPSALRNHGRVQDPAVRAARQRRQGSRPAGPHLQGYL